MQCTFVNAIVDMFLNIFGVQWLCRRQSELLLIAGSDRERERKGKLLLGGHIPACVSLAL